MDRQAARVLILTSDAGFGHRRAAEALKAAFDSRHPPCSADIVNPVQDPELPDLLKQIETGYDSIVTDDPTFYQLAYAATDAPVVAQLVQDIITTAVIKVIRKIVLERKPDAILTTYPVYTQAALRVVREMGSQAPVGVVVTDLVNVHTAWFHAQADLTFVPTGHVYRQAVDQGLPKMRIHLTGLPVHPSFATETRDQRTIRQALGWDPEMVTALVVGSARSAQTAEIARLLDRSGLDLQVVALSGGDPQILAQLQATEWKGRVHIYGFVSNMSEMMHAADFIVCKAGGLIVTESLACGLPMVLYEALPGQEVGNVRYVVDAGAGVWAPGAIGVLTTAYAWLARDRSELEKCRIAAQGVGKPRAAFDVAERILRLIS